jgi:hypothetical protein
MVRREDAPALPPGSRDLDTKLVAALERVGQALRTELRERARQHGLTPTQAQILLRLGSDQPDRRRVGALAATLDARQPTVSDAVATLERKRLLERRRDAADARAAELRPHSVASMSPPGSMPGTIAPAPSFGGCRQTLSSGP